MTSVSPSRAAAIRSRQKATAEIRGSMRELIIQLSLLNHQVSAHLGFKDIDLDCLNLIDRHGPLSPSSLAKHAGLHPATLTGVLDRLERGGWVARERDPTDRRAVVVRALHDRYAELMRLYSGMNRSMNQICAGYADAELDLLADFLHRTAEAGQAAAEALGSD